MSCHIRPGGQPLAGGYGVNTPFGVIYGTNITPDTQTGIGRWSLAAFTRAMREGVSRDGHHLYAAFPYTAFTELSDDDINALYAYLMTRTPVSATIPPNTVPFPLNIRLLEEGWKILFFRKKAFQPDPTKDAEWNRGAYLAEALSDCGGCHTPRNALGAEKLRHAYAGAVVDNWIAPPLTEANPSPVPWTEERLFSYLRTGVDRLARCGVGRNDDSGYPRRPGSPSRPGQRRSSHRSLFQRYQPRRCPCVRCREATSESDGDFLSWQRSRSTTQTPISMPARVFRVTTTPGQLPLRRVRSWRSTARSR